MKANEMRTALLNLVDLYDKCATMDDFSEQWMDAIEQAKATLAPPQDPQDELIGLREQRDLLLATAKHLISAFDEPSFEGLSDLGYSLTELRAAIATAEKGQVD
jgi:hypothetical protein